MAQKKKVENKKFGFNEAIYSLIFIFEVILVFTFFDYLTHTISPEYAVPDWYFQNKIIYGTIIGFIAYFFFRKQPSTFKKSLFISATIAILLQIRYFLIGYPLDFVILFLFIHFAILWIVSYIGLRITKL